jgi:hypothetical protein
MSKTVQFRLKWAQDFRGQQQKVAVHMTSACWILPTGHDGVYFLHAKMLTLLIRLRACRETGP